MRVVAGSSNNATNPGPHCQCTDVNATTTTTSLYSNNATTATAKLFLVCILPISTLIQASPSYWRNAGNWWWSWRFFLSMVRLFKSCSTCLLVVQQEDHHHGKKEDTMMMPPFTVVTMIAHYLNLMLNQLFRSCYYSLMLC